MLKRIKYSFNKCSFVVSYSKNDKSINTYIIFWVLIQNTKKITLKKKSGAIASVKIIFFVYCYIKHLN